MLATGRQEQEMVGNELKVGAQNYGVEQRPDNRPELSLVSDRATPSQRQQIGW